MNCDMLFRLGKPTVYMVAFDDDSFANLYLQLTRGYKNAVIRMIRGKKSETITEFFNEISGALQFPYYFGENIAAFDECITDLDWIEGDAYILMISNADHFLRNAPTDVVHLLMDILSKANEEWLTPNKYIPRSRHPTSFHLLFQCTESNISALTQRLARSSNDLEILSTHQT